MSLSVLLVSGIWPPALGGPATHMPEAGRFLQYRGHAVTAVTSSFGDADLPDFPLRVLRQDRRLSTRLAEGAVTLAAAARNADVVYASGLYGRSTLATTAARRPVVLKLTTDPAYERARRLGMFSRGLEDFQRPQRHPGVLGLQALRALTLAQATHIIVPSRYLARIMRGWSGARSNVTVIPNPRPDVQPSEPRDRLRERFGLTRFTTVFAGRFVPAKDLVRALAAFSATPDGDLVLIGDGPDRAAVEAAVRQLRLRDRVRLVPAMPRELVVDWLAAADLALLPSAWENYPHAAVEALAVGTPVVATAVGGVPEIVTHDQTGLLVAPGDGAALPEALSRCATDHELMNRLRVTIGRHPIGVSGVEAYSTLEQILIAAAAKAR